jgi:Fe-S-cluster containining protein
MRDGMTVRKRQKTELPSFSCKKGCSACCGIVPWRIDEYLALPVEIKQRYPHAIDRKKMQDAVLVFPLDGSVNCPFLKNSRCEVYEHRPVICRIFGMVNNKLLACPEGVKPSHFLKKSKADKLLFGKGSVKDALQKPRSVGA